MGKRREREHERTINSVWPTWQPRQTDGVNEHARSSLYFNKNNFKWKKQVITHTSNISALHFKYMKRIVSCTFTAAPASTTQIQTFKFMLLPPHQVLALLQNVNIADNSGVKLTQVGWELYRELFHGLNQLNNAMAGFRRKQTKQKILY